MGVHDAVGASDVMRICLVYINQSLAKLNMGKAREGGPIREQWHLFAMAMVTRKGGQ